MQALRQRVACVARRSRSTTPRSVRTYASESHGHDHDHHAAPQVAEGLGTAFYIFAGALPTSIFFYQISRPGADGAPSSLTQWLAGFEYFNEWETRNVIRTNMIEQAAHDKHLFLNAAPRNGPHIELKMPELFGAGSPYNIPAGHTSDLSFLTEHYRAKFHEEEERKAVALAQQAARAKATQA